MGTLHTFPTTPTIPAITRILSRFDREQLAAFIEIAIDLADVMGGDPDVELNGDEADDDGDTRDISFSEWHMRGRNKLTDKGGEIEVTVNATEDDEAYGDERDGNGAEDDFMRHHADGPGCPISDAGGGAVDDEGEQREYFPMDPIYALDHSAGPVNEVAIIRDYHRRQLEDQ